MHGWRWLNSDSIHLTLRFLGTVEQHVDEQARSHWARAVAEHAPFDLRFGSLGRFPERGRPRILWAGVEPDPGLRALVSDLEDAARGLGFESESREFRPHLTLARAPRGARVTLPEDWPSRPSAAVFSVSEVILFQSVLHPAGARYTALERYRLG